MRKLIVKYEGTCSKCNNTLEIGTEAMYEKTTGIFCVGCEPTDTEDIRAFRQVKADRKADKYEGWAEKRINEANSTLDYNRKHYTGDIAFNTQPGHIPIRAKVIAQNDKAYESLNIAKKMEEKADSLRHVRVKGDAERHYQAIADKVDTLVTVGSRIFDSCFREGTILKVNKKTYTIKWDSGRTWTREKYFVKPLSD